MLITGASGLLGSYFATLFQVFNRDFGGNVKLFLVSKSDQYQISIYDAVRLKLDLSQESNLNQVGEFDVIMHCAGHAQPSLFQKSPVSTLMINSTATVELMKKLKKGGVFLFLSSSEVYSGSNQSPHKESDIGVTGPSHPRSAYIESKRFGEAIICNSHIDFPEVKTFAARLSLAYGPGVKNSDTRVLNQFITKALKFGVIELLDSGVAHRTYCYVSDAVEMLISIIMSGGHKIYNVGGQSHTTILELAKLIAAKTNSNINLPRHSEFAQIGAPVNVSLDLDRIMTLTGKSTFVSLNDGLDRTIKWFKENLI